MVVLHGRNFFVTLLLQRILLKTAINQCTACGMGIMSNEAAPIASANARPGRNLLYILSLYLFLAMILIINIFSLISRVFPVDSACLLGDSAVK